MTHADVALTRLVLPFDAAGLERLDSLSQDAAATLWHAPLTGTHAFDVSLVAGAEHEDPPSATRVSYWAVPPRSAHEALVRAGWETYALETVGAVSRAMEAAFCIPRHRIDLSLSALRGTDGFSWSWTGHVWTASTRIAFSPKAQAETPSGALARFESLCNDVLALPADTLRDRLA